jgi:hypothetical protein
MGASPESRAEARMSVVALDSGHARVASVPE